MAYRTDKMQVERTDLSRVFHRVVGKGGGIRLWRYGRAHTPNTPYVLEAEATAVFTILMEYGSYLVDGDQIERLNTAKRARRTSVTLDVVCGCANEAHDRRPLEIALADVVAVVGHKGSRNSNVVPFERIIRSA